MRVIRYSLGHGLVSGLSLYELHHESTGCCCIGATLEHILVMQSEFISRLHYGYLMVILCPLLWLRRRNTVLWLPCQPGENKSVCSSYGSFQPLSSCLAYHGFRELCSCVNHETTSAVSRISDIPV